MVKKITRKEFIKKYIKFFESKGHKEIPSASLVPENDPTTLFISAGMHPLVPYLLGQKHPLGKKLVNVQKCLRTGDIEEVGDEFHLTFFEMLGNWSLGDYFKEKAIKMSYEFLTSKKELGLDKNKLVVTIFAGDKNAPPDEDSAKVWLSLGIPKEGIIPLGKEDNWWGPAGNTGPCGPDTEMFYWIGKGKAPIFDPNYSTSATGGKDWVEIWNDVFMEYNKVAQEKYELLKQKNVDTGMGVERMITILQGKKNVYETEVFKPIIKEIEKFSGKKYGGNEKAMRIIADHIKASVFIIADGITPSNTGQGYVLRRLIRRAVIQGRKLKLEKKGFFIDKIAKPVFLIYTDYKELKKNKKEILKILLEEENKFNKTLEQGLKMLKKLAWEETISGKKAFLLYQSYGFPIELTEEIALLEWGADVDTKAFQKELEKHQKLSKTAAKGKFSSGLADNSEQTTKLHTATHLLNEALRKVLGKDVKQKGSNITSERLRFDFNFPRKLTQEEIKKVEKLVNTQISKGLKVSSEEMLLKKALSSSKIQSEFGARYPEKVSVYSIGNFSKEICTGPHVKNTKEIGKFKIIKEQSSASGVRRIKAVVG